MTDGAHQAGQVQSFKRFPFGKNWTRFLAVLDEERIDQACKSLRQMLEVDSLDQSTFLDVGSGSGLFSLAAMRLGAARVVSFDYDPASVACTEELKRRFFPGAAGWTVQCGVINLVREGGLLFIAIYRDQGWSPTPGGTSSNCTIMDPLAAQWS